MWSTYRNIEAIREARVAMGVAMPGSVVKPLIQYNLRAWFHNNHPNEYKNYPILTTEETLSVKATDELDSGSQVAYTIQDSDLTFRLVCSIMLAHSLKLSKASEWVSAFK